MSVPDILILAVLGVGAVLGFNRGIVMQLGQIVAVVAGIILSRLFGPELSGLLAGGDGAGSAVNVVGGYVAVFVIGYGLALLVFRLIRTTVHGVKLGIVDRLAGALFKAAQWLLILSLALNVFFIVTGDEGEFRQPGKPWRAAAIDFAPALLGYLAEVGNFNTDKDVESDKDLRPSGDDNAGK